MWPVAQPFGRGTLQTPQIIRPPPPPTARIPTMLITRPPSMLNVAGMAMNSNSTKVQRFLSPAERVGMEVLPRGVAIQGILGQGTLMQGTFPPFPQRPIIQTPIMPGVVRSEMPLPIPTQINQPIPMTVPSSAITVPSLLPRTTLENSQHKGGLNATFRPKTDIVMNLAGPPSNLFNAHGLTPNPTIPLGPLPPFTGAFPTSNSLLSNPPQSSTSLLKG